MKLDPSKDVLNDKFLTDNTEKLTTDDEPGNIKKLALKLFDFLNGSEDGKKKGKIEDIIGDDANELKIGHTYFMPQIGNTCFPGLIDWRDTLPGSPRSHILHR